MEQLIAYVHVRDDQGAAHVFGPGDELPDWAAARITNPKAWAGGKLPATPATRTSGGDGKPPTAPETDSAPTEDAPTSGQDVPPRAGAGSGQAEWAAYAAAHNVDASGTRTEVIDRLDAAGIPTRPEA